MESRITIQRDKNKYFSFLCFVVVEGEGTTTLSSPTTPPYQRLNQALQTDPRCAQEVALGRRVGLYKFCGDIGRGNFSRVKLAVHQLTRDKVAVKVVDRGRLDARALRMLSREVTTLECVHHPNILRLFEVVETLGRVHLVTEWIRGGELYHRITQGGPLKETQAASLYKQLLLAVKHMHSLGFVHRDIKAENVLLVTEDRIKLADFGFSTQLLNGPWQHLDTFCGSPPYAAPELFSDDHYIGGPVDVWALGVLLYFMVIGNMPFRAPTVPALRAAVLKGDYTLSPLLSSPCIRLIQRILVHTPNRRPTIDQMLSSQWITHSQFIEKLNSQQKSSKKATSFLFSAFGGGGGGSSSNSDRANNKKNRRFGGGGGGGSRNKDRSPDPNSFTTIQCNTKRTNSVLVENFLNPIDTTIPGNELHDSEHHPAVMPNVHPERSKRSIFSGNLKKKIGPMEQQDNLRDGKESFKNNSTKSNHSNSNDIKISDISSIHNYSTSDTKKNSISSLDSSSNNKLLVVDQLQVKNNLLDDSFSDEMLGDFIMLPTCTHDLSHLHPMEIEARRILLNLGINSDMLIRSVPNGPRSDIIGAYRIVVNRLHRQTILATTKIIAQEEINKPKTNRTCAIL